MPNVHIDRSGLRFGRLVVVSRVQRAVWLCRCDCGAEKVIQWSSLYRGATKSCGCFQKEYQAQKHFKHGRHRDRIYKIWQAMKYRCLNPRNTAWPGYGGRGITVCQRWIDSFDNFLADMGEIPTGKSSIERKDNDGPYNKENCVWADGYEQGRNKRNSVHLTYRGRTLIASEWARIMGMKPQTITSRVNILGWSVAKALETPADPRYISKYK